MVSIGNGAFPVPQNRKLLRKRYHSPPCLRNTFLHGKEDAPLALPRAPLPSSRYRCAVAHQNKAAFCHKRQYAIDAA